MTADNDPASFAAAGLPTGLSIDANSGIISGTIAAGADASGPYSITITATDASAGAEAMQTFAWDVSAPVVTVIAPSDQSNLGGDTVTGVDVFADDSAGNALTFTATDLPAGLSIDPNSGDITGTIATSAITGTPVAVTITATDTAANVSGSDTFNWTVNQIAFGNLGQQRNLIGDSAGVSAAATDALGDPLTYSAANLPDGLTIDLNSGAINGTIANDAAQSSPYTVTVSATDGTATATQTFTWIISRITLTNPGTQNNQDGDSVSLGLSAAAAYGHTLVYSAAGLPSGLGIDAASGTISGTIAANADVGSPYTVAVTVADTTDPAITAMRVFAWSVTAPASSAGSNTPPNVFTDFSRTFYQRPALAPAQEGAPNGMFFVQDVVPAPRRTWGQWAEIVGGAFSGLGDGYTMVFNAQLNIITFGNSPLQGRVDNAIVTNGGGYRAANITINLSTEVLATIGIAGATRIALLRRLSAAERAAEIARYRTALTFWGNRRRQLRAALAAANNAADRARLQDEILVAEAEIINIGNILRAFP